MREQSRWEKILIDDFLIRSSVSIQEIDDYKQFDKFELLVILKSGVRILYDYIDHTMEYLRPKPSNVFDMPEKDWRVAYSRRFYKRIRDRGISQNELSEMTGISRVTLSRYINGKATPSLYNAGKLAKALNCDLRDFIRFPG